MVMSGSEAAARLVAAAERRRAALAEKVKRNQAARIRRERLERETAVLLWLALVVLAVLLASCAAWSLWLR
jgi:uncharacterized membrane protein